ncbi:MAG: polyphosphate polymerase domain-containing protein [Bacteroidales bacterium]|nr:polyphosphate polymerase domain-containing protein [Candidatus Equibacterium intestinale]
MPKNKQIEAALEQFDPITIAQMKEIRLMDRIDTKFISSMSQVLSILEMAGSNYFVQEIDDTARIPEPAAQQQAAATAPQPATLQQPAEQTANQPATLQQPAEQQSAAQPTGQLKCRLCSYRTLYYDTPGRDMYILHHNRHLKRQKIRSRVYVESDLYFIEVKNKSNKGRTAKVRTTIRPGAFMNVTADPDAREYLKDKSDFPVDTLEPALMTEFDRITLVNKARTERVTIDTNLRFTNQRTGISVCPEQLAILELKRDGRAESGMLKILNELRIKNISVSKYCIGTAMTDPEIKKNRFKKKIRLISKITPLNYDSAK